jgi:hypothetical protein
MLYLYVSDLCFVLHIPPFPCRHPELHPDEISAIEEMFEEASKKGWVKE